MKKILAVIILGLGLSGCAGMEFVAVDYHSGHNYGPSVHPTGHISYTLGYYSGSHYNGYSVYGSHGHRYYYAPQYYSHHRHYSAPPVVVHRHVHTSVCYARGGHSYVAPRVTPTRHRRVPQTAPPRQRENRADRQDRREDKKDRRRERERHRK
jgi:hypothetical protein